MGADASDRDGFAAGNAAFKAGAFDEAVAHFSRAISVQPDDERVWSNRCAAHLRRGDLDAAEADAARCAELAPRWHKAHYRVGKVQHERGELVAAWQSYYTAHVLEPALPLYAHMMAAVDERLAAPDAADAARAELRALKLRILKVDPMAALTPSDPSRCVPVTVLSGFLGAGKTSLLRHVLSARHGLRLAVIVNDMAELNVDAALVRAAGVQGVAVVRADDRLIELSNGCICCTLREDLLAEVAALCLAEPRYDGIVIESSGISEPTPVAQTFLYEDLLGRSLAHLARLDTMVTVVDAQRFALDLESGDALAARGLGARDGDARGIGELLVSQAECADVFLLNKADLVSADHLAQLGASLRALNPGAEQLVCSHGVVAVARVLHTGLFDWAKAMRSPGWLRELSAAAHAPESEAYGVRSFVYRRARPFHAARLAALLRARREEPSHCMHARKLLRSKGFWWLDDAPALRLEWATAAADFNPQVLGCWLSALADASAASRELVAAVSARECWHAAYGDRKTELVCIGVGLERDAVEAALDGALLSADEEAALCAGGLHADRAAQSAFAHLLGPAMAQLDGGARDGQPAAAAIATGAPSHEAHAGGPHVHDGACAPAGGGCQAVGWPSKDVVEAMLAERLAYAAAESDAECTDAAMST